VEDTEYHNKANEDLVVSVEASGSPEVLVSTTTLDTAEGTERVYQVALATAPSDDVTVTFDSTWLAGLPRDVEFNPDGLTFPAGESNVYQTVRVIVPYEETSLGPADGSISMTLESEDLFYDSDSPLGVTPPTVDLHVEDIDEPGLCLKSCAGLSRFEMKLTGEETGPVETPYEIAFGQVIH
jgi:hypothetical protein